MTGRNRPQRALSWILPVVACCVAYGNTLANDFVLDDHQGILDNPLVNGQRPALEALGSPWQVQDSVGRLYRPLTTWTLSWQWSLHGPDPRWFHLGNLLLHIGATLLVQVFASRLFPSRPAAAVCSALLYAVHPIHTDAVSSIVNRSEVLAAGLALSSWWCWDRWLQHGQARLLVATSVLSLAALASKESGGPVVLFAAIWALVGQRDGSSWRRWLPAFALAFLLPLGLYVVGRSWALEGTIAGMVEREHQFLATADRATRVRTVLSVLARHLSLWIVPHPLSADYSCDSLPLVSHWTHPWTLAGLLVVPLGIFAGIHLLRSPQAGHRGLGLALCWAGCFLLPTTHLIPLMNPMAERMAYGASAGGIAILGWALGTLRDRWGPRATILVAGVLAVLTLMTVLRNQDWRDDERLAQATLRAYPRNALMWANLGMARARQGDGGGAVAALHRAIEIAPAKWEFRLALAGLLHDSGLHRDEADLLFNGLPYVPHRPDARTRTCEAFREVQPELSLEKCRSRIEQRRYPLSSSLSEP